LSYASSCRDAFEASTRKLTMHILLVIAIAWAFYADYKATGRRKDELQRKEAEAQARFNNRLDMNRMDKF
jgi:hypothetical protein